MTGPALTPVDLEPADPDSVSDVIAPFWGMGGSPIIGSLATPCLMLQE
jgi:hypothetical protein